MDPIVVTAEIAARENDALAALLLLPALVALGFALAPATARTGSGAVKGLLLFLFGLGLALLLGVAVAGFGFAVMGSQLLDAETLARLPSILPLGGGLVTAGILGLGALACAAGLLSLLSLTLALMPPAPEEPPEPDRIEPGFKVPPPISPGGRGGAR